MQFKNYILLVSLFIVLQTKAQNIGINNSGNSPNASALLDIDAAGISPKLGLLIPRVTAAEKTAMNPLPAVAQGLLVYQTDGLEGFYYNISTTTTPDWVYISTSTSYWSILGNTVTGTLPANPNEWIGTVNLADLVFKSNSAERLRIKSNGNIGINTNNPSQLLHVSGGSILTDRAFAAAPNAIFASSAAFNTGTNNITQLLIVDDGSAIANGNLTYGGCCPTEGQFLWITNADAQNVVYASSTPSTNIPAGKTMGFVYLNGNWYPVSADNANSFNWTTTGNAGTSSATNFIGTTDNQAFVFKVRNQSAGKIDGANNNVFLGEFSGASVTTGTFNTFYGDSSGQSLTTAQRNTLIGYNSGRKINANFNTALGANSLQNATSGNSNTAIGESALSSLTTGSENVGVGTNALLTTTNLSGLTAIGRDALRFNSTGNRNTAIGYLALRANTSGNDNTAIGGSAMLSNNTGLSNTAIGSFALKSNTAGSSNTAVGTTSLQNNTTGIANTAIGNLTLFSNTTGGLNTAIGDGAASSNANGSENIAIGVNALQFNTNGSRNVSIGNWTLNSNSNGYSNVAVGYEALRSNTGGYRNIALGDSSLRSNVTGNQNISIGYRSMFTNNSGNFNVSIGDSALFSNSAQSELMAIGKNALRANVTGVFNTAVGVRTLQKNISGSSNTSVGYQALSTSITSENTAMGAYALEVLAGAGNLGNTSVGAMSARVLTSGANNAFLGKRVAEFMTSGSSNVFIGATAGSTQNAYSNCTFLGFGADANANNMTNSMALGSGTLIAVDNFIAIGNTSITNIRGQVNYTTYSDGRVKDNIEENVPGLDFIKKLRPVTYNYNIHRENELLGVKESADYPSKYNIEKIKFSGFIAQEVEKAAQDIGYDFSGIDKPKSDKDVYGLRYAEFVVPLVKSVQELNSRLEKLELENQNLRKELETLKKK